MFSKSLITLIALAALAISAPIANIEGSSGDYQYLSRRGGKTLHRSASLPPSQPSRPTVHRSQSLPAHGSSPPHSPHGSHHGSPPHSAHNTPPHSPTNAHASGSHAHPHQHLINEVQAAGHKISPADVVHIWRLPRPIPGVNGKHAWLEKGSETAGMHHIMDKHGAQFADNGIHEQHIPHLAEKATTTGEIVGTQGSTRTIYKTDFNGKEQHVAIETGNNGFVVGMNPSSEKSVKKAAKAWKARLAKNAANPPDEHPGKGPGPGPGPSGGAGGGITARR